MKKCIAALAAVTLSVGFLAGCGDSYEATESTVFVQKDGTVLSTDIESFDPGSYDESGLSAYVDEAIESYIEENGKDSVKLKDLSFENGTATLSIEYATVSDYSNFNGIEMFSGSIAEALAAGYSFDVDFAAFADGKKTACDSSEFLNSDGYKVVIIKANTNVHVSGKVKYASYSNVSLIDSSTVAISAEYTAEDETALDTETVDTEEQDTQESAFDTESTEIASDEGSIDDDEFVLEDEDTEVVFEFEEQERPKTETDTDSDSGSYTSVYTYIIYK